MKTLCGIAAFCTLALATNCFAADGIVWEKDLDAAKSAAKRSNRLVLVHFGASWCKHCQQLERDVFSAPDFGKELKSNYVAVKLDYDHFPATARQYGVGTLPCDVVLAPNGDVIDRMSSPMTATEYVTALDRVAVYARTGQRPPPQQTAMAGGGAAMATAEPQSRTTSPNAFGVNTPAAATPRQANNPYLSAFQQQPAPPVVTPTTGAQPYLTGAAQPPAGQTDWLAAQTAAAHAPPAAQGAQVARRAPQIPPGNPPLAMSGYCPVSLVERKDWKFGDPRYGIQHRGRTYLFAGPLELERFRANPDAYSPVLSGNDAVLELDEHRSVPGDVDYGVFCRGHIYLFSSKATLDKFFANQPRYVIESQDARTANAPGAATVQK